MTTIVDPATGEAFTEVPDADAAEVHAAVGRAAAAWESWRDVSPADRSRLLRRFADVVDSHQAELAVLPGSVYRFEVVGQ